MRLLLRRLAGAVSAPLRCSLCTAALRPPWAMVYSKAALDASGASSPGARASLDLDAAPYVSHISVPAHLADGMDFAATSVRATSSDGLLLLDLAEARHLPSGPPGESESLDRDNRKVLRRFLSDTGEWDERQLFVLATIPDWPRMQIDTNYDILALGDRLWWVDLTWGAFSVNAFSDRPEYRFVELPQGSVLSDVDMTTEHMMLGKCWLIGVTEGKLRYIEVSTEKEPFVIRSFSLDDDEGCCWKLTRRTTVYLLLPNRRKPLEKDMPWIVAIDPFNADILYYQHGHTIIAMDMAKGEVIGKRPFPDSITGLSRYNNAFFLPCLLPTWLESNHIPGAGTLSSKNTNCERKTLADMLVRADRDEKS